MKIGSNYTLTRTLLLAVLVLTGLGTTPYSAHTADSHVAFSRGISKPPFLSYGIKPNLLLLFDNSGSMLDMAYGDEDTDGETGSDKETQCFDGSYMLDPTPDTTAVADPGLGYIIDSTLEYAGHFKRDSWYVWRESYGTGGATAYLADRAYPTVSYWQKGNSYYKDALVIDNGVFYKASCADAAPSCTSSATAESLSDDTGINWLPATDVYRWMIGATYPAGSFIKHMSQVYYLSSPTTGSYVSSTDPATDKAHWTPVSYTWRSGVGYSAGSIVTYKGMVYRAKIYTNSTSFDFSKWERLDEGYFEEVTTAPCESPSYSLKYTADDGSIVTDLKISMKDASDATVTTDPQTAASVSCFAAKGNFLNWAAASKFDIQKKILTGGKYYTGYEEANNAVTTDNGDDRLIGEHRGCAGSGFIKQVAVKETSSSLTRFLTLRVRGAMGDTSWIEQTYDRVDTTDNTTRVEVLAVSASGFNPSPCISAAEILTSGSSGASAKTEVNACLNVSSGSLSGTEKSTFILTLNECTQAWKGISPNVTDLEAHCKSLYNSGILPSSITPWDPEYLCYGVYDPTISLVADREGYFGACWNTASTTSTCTIRATCSGSGVYYSSTTGLYHKCTGAREEQCPAANWNAGSGKCNSNGNNDNNGWVQLWVDDSGGYCTPLSTTAGWASDPSTCTQDAAVKFCGQLKLPEVIDPSDVLTATTSTYNIPAMMIDAGVMEQLGISRPLAVLKGYLKQPVPPEGILQATAEDLRIGAMAFNSVGSASEGSTNSYIERFSPPGNKDGARVISEIKLGGTVTDTNGTDTSDDDRHYVDDLAEAINDVKATSWTPLSEAMYNAIGYYTQNSDLRINTDDFPIGTGHDPIEKWCQNNNILIITEGASTADLNAQVKTFVDGAAIVDDDDTEIGKCSGGLDGSTYLDDLTYHAQKAPASLLYPVGKSQMLSEDGTMEDKQNITTYVVATGDLRGSATDTSECTAARLITSAATNGGTSLYDSSSPKQLEENLLYIFNALRQRASSGSAASVISSSRGGEGAIYQAIFWPEIKRKDAANKEYTASWTGDVHALFVDSTGSMYEDTDGDHTLTPSEDTNENGLLEKKEDVNENGRLDGDRKIIIYYDEQAEKSMACYNIANWQGTCPVSTTVPAVQLEEVKFLWSAGKWLSDISDTSENRTPYISANQQRYIYTWNDLDNDGIVRHNNEDTNGDGNVDHPGEWLPFVAATKWGDLPVAKDRSGVPVDFDVVTSTSLTPAAREAKVDDIVEWIRGKDRLTAVDFNGDTLYTDDGEAPRRSRQLPVTEGSGSTLTARLGDIIHSTPMTVATPAENFHLIYSDRSYADFIKKYKDRRHVIYFGANDGMLHAVNGGFYVENINKFCTTPLVSGNCIDDSSQPALGSELWAYVPYNLLPHLSSLANPDYGDKTHKYFVDLRPRIFDVQIFKPGVDSHNIDHPNGWGTILVGGMRLGGAPVNATELKNSSLNDDRQFMSSYFIFDITDPEKPPVLLGELTRRNGDVDVDLGHSVAISTMVIMKATNADTQSENNQWYLLFGSGPHAPIDSNDAMKGLSDQAAKLSVLPLNWLVETAETPRTAMRIPAAPPTSTNPGGTFVISESLSGTTGGFTGDLVTVDFDISPSYTSYMADAVYFGTNVGKYAYKLDGSTYWDGGGRLYRLITRNKDAATGSYLFGKSIEQQITQPHQWDLTTLMDVKQPVTGAFNVGYDGNNFWVYAGTGRFFDAADKTDDTQQSFYGIKEPMQATAATGVKELLGTTVLAPTQHGESASTTRNWPIETAASGTKGLLKVDEIRVKAANTPLLATLSCRDGSMECIPSSMKDAKKTSYADLIHYIADPDPVSGESALYNSTDGWYVDFYSYANRERNTGQSTLFGGLVTFTTYQPYSDPCKAEGESFLYTLYYQTGTAWYKSIFGQEGLYENSQDVREKVPLGPGLSTTPDLHTSGDGESVTVLVQTSTGVIVEQKQDEMATSDYFTGRTGWRECTK